MNIPLFPLNMVIFPGWPTPLHVFEPRYKALVQYCVREEEPFGLVLIQEGGAEFDTAVVPHKVGCSVTITQLQQTEDGRYYLMGIGQQRFRIQQLHHDQPYLSAEVEFLHYPQEATDRLMEEAQRLRPLVIDYFATLAKLAHNDTLDANQVPRQPQSLANMAAAILQVPLAQKQSMLEAHRLSSLLAYLVSSYQHQIDLLRLFPQKDMGVFSPN
jgi:Lon protease-like protein